MDELTLEQAKAELEFYVLLSNKQSQEIGRLTTELMKSNISNSNLQQLLKDSEQSKEQ